MPVYNSYYFSIRSTLYSITLLSSYFAVFDWRFLVYKKNQIQTTDRVQVFCPLFVLAIFSYTPFNKQGYRGVGLMHLHFLCKLYSDCYRDIINIIYMLLLTSYNLKKAEELGPTSERINPPRLVAEQMRINKFQNDRSTW